jgi:hypothetical protein
VLRQSRLSAISGVTFQLALSLYRAELGRNSNIQAVDTLVWEPKGSQQDDWSWIEPARLAAAKRAI